MSLEKATHQIANILHSLGGTPLLVGGFVRDQLLGLPSKDVDIEVHGLNYKEIKEALTPHFKLDFVGESFGVIKVFLGDDILDISLPRTESKTGQGHRAFQMHFCPEMTLEQAFRRRDLTVNAIGRNLVTGELIDLFGGVKDLQEKVLRVVDPETFVEDPLRALRVAQFASRFGMTPDADLVSLCSTLDLSELPLSRIEEEFTKLLVKGAEPSLGLRFLRDADLLRFFPELQISDFRFEHLCTTLDRMGGMTLTQRLAILAHQSKSQHTLLERVCSAKAIIKDAYTILNEFPRVVFAKTIVDVRCAANTFDLQQLVEVATCITDKDLQHVLDLALSEDLLHNKPIPLVTGEDLKQLGWVQGKALGDVLKTVFSAQLMGRVNTKEQGLQFAKEQQHG